MKADVHFTKGERMESSQAKLDAALDWEAIIEMCYQAAHQFILAGVEWRGTPHPSNHPHAADAGLLNRIGAPLAVQQAWREIDVQRSGGVYGKQPDGVESGKARDRMRVIKDWAMAAKP